MGRVIATYRVIVGIIVVVGIQLSIRFQAGHGLRGIMVGYLTTLVALTMIFIGVQRYRDTVKGGLIGF